MCEFCESSRTPKGHVFGKDIKINKCANETDLTDCQVVFGTPDTPALIIFAHGEAKGYVDIAYCPICGRKLSEEAEKPNVDELLEKIKENLAEEDVAANVKSI